MRIGIVIGSIRQQRFGEGVGRWVADRAEGRTAAEYVLIDLRDFNVPLFTSATHPMMAKKQYDSAEVNAWSQAIDSCDGFIFVTPEYNHSFPGAFKNAVDSLGAEWMGKAVGFVAYGTVGGSRAIEAWRDVVANFSMFDIRAEVNFVAGFDYHRGEPFASSERRDKELDVLFEQLEGAVARQG